MTHLPVLYNEIIHAMQPLREGLYVDGTLGVGGHAWGILQASHPDGRLLGLDVDPQALELAQVKLAEFGERVILVRASYRTLLQRYVKKDGTPRHYVAVSWIAQVVILVVGIFFGYQAASINQVTQWIVNGHWGGYTAPNILKWHWYRFNGYGYFWGMLSGIAAALALPKLFPGLHPLWGFIPIFLISLAASVLGSLLSDPEPDDVLARFYRQVSPWGFWGPVLARVRSADPSFAENRGMGRDALNTAIAIVAQMTLVTIPLYMVFWDMKGLLISALVLIVTGWILKKNWYEKLDA